MQELYRQCNRRAYDIDGQINDLYCEKDHTTDPQHLLRQISVLNTQVDQLRECFQKEIKPGDPQQGYWQE